MTPEELQHLEKFRTTVVAALKDTRTLVEMSISNMDSIRDDLQGYAQSIETRIGNLEATVLAHIGEEQK